jgi:hypothetical protein
VIFRGDFFKEDYEKDENNENNEKLWLFSLFSSFEDFRTPESARPDTAGESVPRAVASVAPIKNLLQSHARYCSRY